MVVASATSHRRVAPAPQPTGATNGPSMKNSRPGFLGSISRMAATLSCIGLLGITLAATSDSPTASVSQQGTSRGRDARVERVFSVTHGVVATQLVTAGSQGHQLGDLRVLTATPILDASGTVVGRLDAQLLTTTIDFPTPGDEVRMSTLNFVFGQGTTHYAGSADQLIVSGSGYYPGNQSTIPVGNALIRPITGGSGAYAGASGWAETEHFLDGTWRHTFHLLPTPRR